jgi:hypothetical protein
MGNNLKRKEKQVKLLLLLLGFQKFPEKSIWTYDALASLKQKRYSVKTTTC